MTTRAHSHRLRTGRVSELGRGYLLTTVTFKRECLFDDFTLARAAILELRRCDSVQLSNTIAYVLMPDHLHWLVQLQSGELSDLVRQFKSRSAIAVNRRRGTAGGPVWQRGFHDQAIRDGADIRALARYVIGNPIRAGLVDTANQYPHWDAMWL